MSDDIRAYIRLVEGVPSQHFATLVKNRVADAFADELAASSAATNKMHAAWKGYGTSGVSWPTGSFGVSTSGDEFHLNLPTQIATPEAVERLHQIITQTEEETGVKLSVRREVRGGSNFVMDGIVAAS